MATGIRAKNSNKHIKMPVSVSYEGKKPEESIMSRKGADFSVVRSINGSGKNMLFYADNLDVLLYLLNNGYRGKVSLIYIDPPFSTSSDFINRKQEHAYSDNLCGAEYVEFLRERLILMREILSDNGSVYLHLDNKMAFTMKLVMDEIFGENNFRAFITRKKCSTKNYTNKTYGNISDYIMFYSKGPEYVWNRPYEAWEMDRMIEEYPCIDENGRRYKKVPLHAPGARNGESGKEWRGKMPPAGKHWQYTPEKLDELDAEGQIYWSSSGNPRRKVYCNPSRGIPLQDIWLNYRDSVNQAQKTTGYPTEKNYEMLKMIVSASSNPGDIVLDCFAGSGTTLGAAFEYNRMWIGADNSAESIKAILKRFTSGLDIYGDYVSFPSDSKQLSSGFENKCPFTVLTTEKLKAEIEEICGAEAGDENVKVSNA